MKITLKALSRRQLQVETRQELHCFDTTLSALFFKSTSCSHIYQYFLAELPLKRKGAGLY